MCWNRIIVLGLRVTLLLPGLMYAGVAPAVTRAWLERDHVAIDEPVTLSIETDQHLVTPDYSPLQSGFSLSRQSTSQQVRVVNGSSSVRTLFKVSLTPRQLGEHALPVLKVGADTTKPLRLTVSAMPSSTSFAQATSSVANTDELVFVNIQVDDPNPYVQQNVGVTVRLYFATQLATGELDLETPTGASLQRIGNDAKSVQELNGRRYNVVERRFLLVPDHSGPLLLQGARFNGRALGGFFDDYFGSGSGSGSGELNARSADTTLNVRAQPDGAPQPWLPLRDLQLRYTTTPQRMVAGEAAQITIEARAVGATQAQFPELPILSVSNAQVFAEPVQYDERFSNGSAQLKLIRRYSIVPNRAGPLSVPGLKVSWWDVSAGVVRETALPTLDLEVAPGSASFATQPAPSVDVVDASSEAPDALISSSNSEIAGSGRPWVWIALTLVFALLWLSTMLWVLFQRRGAAVAMGAVSSQMPVSRQPNQAALRKALDAAGLDEVSGILCAMAAVNTLDQVIERLQSQKQRAALLRMQRARWAGDGDVDIVSVRQELRQAFWNGPDWTVTAAVKQSELEPLYPRAPHY